MKINLNALLSLLLILLLLLFASNFFGFALLTNDLQPFYFSCYVYWRVYVKLSETIDLLKYQPFNILKCHLLIIFKLEVRIPSKFKFFSRFADIFKVGMSQCLEIENTILTSLAVILLYGFISSILSNKSIANGLLYFM